MHRAFRIALKALAYLGVTLLVLTIGTIASCYGNAWLKEREWEASKHRIRIDEVEVFDVAVEVDPDHPGQATFTGKVRNHSKQYILADVEATAVFVQCDASGSCADVRGWGGKGLAFGWRLHPGKTAEFRFDPWISEERPRPGGKITAKITVTGTRARSASE